MSERTGKVERKGEKKKRKGVNEYIFPLSTSRARTVCILSRAAPREFNSIFNLPKPLYANSATDVEYFWTFSSRFCVPSAPAATPTPLFLSYPFTVSYTLRLCLSYLSFSMAQLPPIRIRRAKGGTRSRHFLPPLRMLQSESSGEGFE